MQTMKNMAMSSSICVNKKGSEKTNFQKQWLILSILKTHIIQRIMKVETRIKGIIFKKKIKITIKILKNYWITWKWNTLFLQ